MGVYVHFLLDPDDPAPEKKGRGVMALGASRRRETSCALGPDHTGGGEGSRDALTLTPDPPPPPRPLPAWPLEVTRPEGMTEGGVGRGLFCWCRASIARKDKAFSPRF